MTSDLSTLHSVLKGKKTSVDSLKKKSTPEVRGKETSEFQSILSNEKKGELDEIKLSKHAQKRIEERKLNFNTEEFMGLNNAYQKLKAKGGKESLVITGQGAYILDVNKGKVITAIDKNELKENIFTNIDSTIIV